ncbi:MAG TPA: serine/threonine-protein kinase PknK, partial [Polyangia bacterium]|nr:serine/threonine-protein kinase PknK [Polyangia bacterium]
MARCPTCHRRISPESRCPADGAVAPSEPAPPSSVPPSIWGYEIRRPLGAGGFGAVWEALPDAGGGPVAIKVAHSGDADSLRRLGREADALDRVGPPHVPALHRRGALADGRPYLAMERLQGRLLADEMALWPGPPPLATVQGLAEALLASASAVATAGLLH